MVRFWTAAVCASLLATGSANAQLRVVSYNTATGNGQGGIGGRTNDFSNVLDFIGRQEVNGFAKPIDVLVLQEQADATGSVNDFAAILNNVTGTSNYVGWSQNPFGTDGLDTGFVYNSATVTPFLEDWFGTGSSRATARIGLTPVGYTDASLYIYSTHHTAGTGNGDLVERRDEAFDLRIQNSFGSTNAGNSGVRFGTDATGTGALPTDANIIYAGDFNQRSSFEEASNDPFAFVSNPYEILKLSTGLSASGAGQAVDPIAQPGNWNNNFGFRAIHTQSPHDGSFGLVTGGVDDRFDFQMVSTELNDGEGLSYIGPNAGNSAAFEESYYAFGNDGTTFNTASSSPSNTALDWIIAQSETLPGLTPTQTRNAVRSSVARASDHLPVVADYQLPAILSATASTVPPTLSLGQVFDVTVTVENAASVLASLAADELDYTLSVSGDLSGGGSGTELALGGGDQIQITLDTSTAGVKSGTITVTTNSLDAENALVQIPVSYSVIGGILGDVDIDGDIDASDIDFLYDNFGSSDPIFDIDGDAGVADQQDVEALVQSVLMTEFGDANLDRVVDSADFSILSSSFGSEGGWGLADFTGDGLISSADFSILSTNFGFGQTPSVAVPEPSSLLGATAMIAALSYRGRERRSGSDEL